MDARRNFREAGCGEYSASAVVSFPDDEDRCGDYLRDEYLCGDVQNRQRPYIDGDLQKIFYRRLAYRYRFVVLGYRSFLSH